MNCGKPPYKVDDDTTPKFYAMKFSLLHHMVAYGSDAIQRILFSPANIRWEGLIKATDIIDLTDQINANRPSIMRFAVTENQQIVVQQLLEEATDVNLSYSGAKTPLHFAVETGVVDMARFLIQKGADVKAIDADDKSLLHYNTSDNLILDSTLRSTRWFPHT